MSRTKVHVSIDTDCHEIIPNLPLSKLVLRNFKKVGAAEVRRGRPRPRPATAGDDPGRVRPEGIEGAQRHDRGRLPAKPYQDAGSTDVGDISWHVPTGGFGDGLLRRGQSRATAGKTWPRSVRRSATRA